MNKTIINFLKITVFLAIGIFLLWLVYRDQEFEKVFQGLKAVNYKWIWLSIFMGIISHISRALRWKMLARSLGYNPSTLNSFFSVMISYFANLALPRFGEVTRAIVIKKYEKIPFTESFGTIVLERIIDLFALFILTGIVLIFRFDVLSGFIRHNPAAGDKFADFEFSYTWIIYFAALLILGTGGFLILRHKIRHTVFYKKISDLVRKFLDGIKSIKKIKNLPVFLLHTVFIWTMYFMMLYVTFFAFGFTSHLTPFTALVVFVFASYGMVAPVQGGIGAWHFMVIGTLAVFQIGNEEAGIFAFVVHSAQTLMLVALGIISFIGMPIFNKIRQHDNIRKDSQ